MTLAIVYDPLDHKARCDTYSYVYRGMLDAIIERFHPLEITGDCRAEDILADAILFWDPNSCHHIMLKGIEDHPALKLEYMSDPFQVEVCGVYQRYNMPVHKLSAEQRIARALGRGVRFILSPTRQGYMRFFASLLGADRAERMLWFFPPAPWFESGSRPLAERRQAVLANGATGEARGAYEFRTWAYGQPRVTRVPHFIADRRTPMGKDYGQFLEEWAGALALCDLHPVVKYYEMPLAGCVTFMQPFPELEELGFRDGESCIYVTRETFDHRVAAFLADSSSYQGIADAGRKLIAEHYTARHFAEFLERGIASEGAG